MDSGKIQNYFKLGEQYFNQMGFPDTWQECTKFKDGDQWPQATEKTKNMPRPVINIIRFIEDHKCSSILSEPIKMIFKPEEILMDEAEGIDMNIVGAELFTQFSEVEWTNVDQEGLNEEACEKAAELGAGIYHYFLDNSIVKGKVHIVKGFMQGEILHPLSVMVGNPQCLKTQLQPYILIPVRDDLESIKARAKKNGIKPDELLKIQGDKDIKDLNPIARFEVQEKANEITCYWKENGTIWIMKVCGNVVTQPPVDTEHKLYPIARFNWYKQDKNWYGMSETKGLISNQKSINFMTAIGMMREILMGMPKLMLKKGIVKNFNNDPATPIMNEAGTEWGAQYLQPPQQSGKGQELTDFLLSSTKTHAGSTETATGELSKSAQMNATAIMMLQKASAVPLDQIKKRFRRTQEEIGHIMMEFWTINYNTQRVINIKDPDGNETPTMFRGSDFKDISLKLKISIGASTEYSESLTMASLDKFLDKQLITFKQYLESAPESVIPFKEKLLKELEQQQADQGNVELTPEEQATISMLPPEQQQQAMMELQGQKAQQQPIQSNQQPNQQPQQNQGGIQ